MKRNRNDEREKVQENSHFSANVQDKLTHKDNQSDSCVLFINLTFSYICTSSIYLYILYIRVS